MQCPHCLQHFYSAPLLVPLGDCGGDTWAVTMEACPNCGDSILVLQRHRFTGESGEMMIYPKATGRPAVPQDVPEAYAADYRDAAFLLEASPKASAAMSRRCLRRILHETIRFHGTDLESELDALLASKQLPWYLADSLRTFRRMADFAAHPAKSLRPAEISDVQTGEAEWLLDTLDALFAFYFIQPAETDRKYAALMAMLRTEEETPVAS